MTRWMAVAVLASGCTIINDFQVVDELDAGSDAGIARDDAATDGGMDAGPDAQVDAGPDAAPDAGPDAGDEDGGRPLRCVPPDGATPVIEQLALRAEGGCAILSTTGGSRLFCWGSRGRGQLGDGSTEGDLGPLEVGVDLEPRFVAVHESHSCLFKTRGPNEVQCWGEGTSGALGTGCSERICGLSAAYPATAPALLAVGDGFTIETHGLPLLSWGSSAAVATPMSDMPVPRFELVAPPNELDAAASHACARIGPQVFCWGANESGQLGYGPPTSDGGTVDAGAAIEADPRVVELPGCDAVQVDLADRASCAVCSNGGLTCWGVSTEGVLGGRADAEHPREPEFSELGEGIAQVAIHQGAAANACVLLRSGEVHCRGNNDHGQLGRAESAPSSEWEQITGVSDAVAIDVGDGFACAVERDCQVVCWGRGAFGRLGDGGGANHITPVTVRFPLP